MQAFPVPLSQPFGYTARFIPGNHEGVDIFAAEGTPVYAIADGQIRHSIESKGGNVIYLTEADGTQWHYGHLQRFSGPARQVQAGDLIGYVGTSGNATGKDAHIHLEWRPQGGAKADPAIALDEIQFANGSDSSGGDFNFWIGFLDGIDVLEKLKKLFKVA